MYDDIIYRLIIMKKHIVAAIAVAAFSTPGLSAQGQWNVLTETYSVDTLYHATVGPGTTETELRIESLSADRHIVNNIFYTETDLTNPYVEMRAAKGGNHMRKLETVPDIAARMSKPGEKYFAGVNADFFNMGSPYNSIGMCIADGFLTNYATDGADIDPHYIVFDSDGIPLLARHVVNDWEGHMIFPDGSSSGFYLNTGRGENEILVYTPQWQYYDSYSQVMHEVGHTGTNIYGVEVSVRPVGRNVLYGNNLQLEVIEDPVTGVGDMAIPADGYVISAHGTARQYLSALHKGDVVIASVGIRADGKSMPVKELLGGFPRILNNGTLLPAPGYPGHLKNPEPRSAVGYNKDKTKLYMLVVDGRNAGGSSGVTQRELAAIMRNIGCSYAMNFDGGGSSTMFVDGFGVKNVPSSSSLDARPEGEPRTVVNALFAVSTAPVDNNIASIELRDKKVELSSGESYRPVVYGYNRYGVLVSTDLDGCSFLVPEAIASVSGNALTGAEGKYSGLLTAVYGELTYSVPIYLNGGGDFVSGIEDPVCGRDDVHAPEYYLLNGVRVESPSGGNVVIVRNGTEVSKQAVR